MTSEESQIILNKFNTLMYIDNNITSIIDNYIYGDVDTYYPCKEILKSKYTTRYGIRDGEYKEWYINEVLRIKTNYKNGYIHGKYYEWWSNIRLMFDCSYKEGICEYCKAWDRAGNLLP